MTKLLIALFLTLSVPAFAQVKLVETPASLDVDAPTPLTELETFKLDRVIMLRQVEKLLKELADMRTLYADAIKRLSESEQSNQVNYNNSYLGQVIQGMEAARPGFKFDVKTSKFIKVEQPSKP